MIMLFGLRLSSLVTPLLAVVTSESKSSVCEKEKKERIFEGHRATEIAHLPINVDSNALDTANALTPPICFLETWVALGQ
jgi:hypothetical protein